MKYEKGELSLENGLKKEWIITNGIGGYSSSTIIGANTRKYHGLLVAPMMPPGNRQLILSKVDESVNIEGRQYNLYTNVCKNFISDGYKNLVQFEKDYVPIFTYKVEDIQIKKFVCLENGKNTVGLYYYIKNDSDKKATLTLAPIINFRGFHTTNTSEDFQLQQNVENNKVRLIVNNNSQNPIYTYASEGKYIEHHNDIFRDMYYVEEEKEDKAQQRITWCQVYMKLEIEPNESKYVTFVCSLEQNIEEIDAKDLINKEIVRLSSIIYNTDILNEKNKEAKDEEYSSLVKNFIIATDNFVVYRPSFALYTLIAGYPWFLDWGRDTLIAFEGILLKTRRFAEAKEVYLLA